MKRHDINANLILALLWAVMLLPVQAHANALEKLFAPDAKLWERWSRHDATDTRKIDHARWNAIVARYVKPSDDGMKRVAYGDVSEQDKAVLDAYIADLAAVGISGYAREQQFAYWVNLYNALTVQVVLDHYPVDSISDIDISPGLFADGPWKKKLVEIEGESVSLDDIEHRILRPIWRDPRIHYAVNCASVGCPDLQPEAFTAANAERLLDKGARDYINHPRGVRVGADGVTLSSIFNWFAGDFGEAGGALGHIREHASADLRARLEGVSDDVAGYAYDWALNDVSAK